MKKTLLPLVTTGLFLAGLLLINKSAYASGTTWKIIYSECNVDPNIIIKVCGAGTESSCTPWGDCPPKALQ